MKKKLIFLVPLMVLVLFSSTAVYAEGISTVKVIVPVGESSIIEKIPIEEMPIADSEISVKDIPNTNAVDAPQEDIFQEVQKIRIAIEILVYGAFPVCVAVLILVKLLSFFGRHYAR